MEIRDKEILIRSAREADALLLNCWWNDGTLMAHVGFPEGLKQSLEDTLKNIRAYTGKLSQLCIIEIDGVPVGECSYQVYEQEICPGWKICEPTYQSRGYGSRVIRMTIDHIFSDRALNSARDVQSITWDTMLDNACAQKVYERLPGVKRLGVRENCFRDQTGIWRSVVDYELTREAWEQRVKE